MTQEQNSAFPEQDKPEKIHGTTDESGKKEKYLRDSGKIEDLPEPQQPAKMSSEPGKKNKNESAHLTDRSGEEKKEDYINTDERKKDLNQRGL
jgi:hypothetical protein